MNKRNLANGQLLDSVDNVTTTWVLEAGQGLNMPPVPFFITATPLGRLSSKDNSEIVEVTARTGDTLTVSRGMRGTTPKSFDAGAIVANGVYVEDLASKPIDVTSATAAATAAKVGTTSGSYTPTTGDIVEVTFVNGSNVNNPTLNIDGSGAKNIRLGQSNVTTLSMGLGTAAGSNVKIRMWYDGTYWQIYGVNGPGGTTYSEITDAEINTGTASTGKLISGRRSKTIQTGTKAVYVGDSAPVDTNKFWYDTDDEESELGITDAGSLGGFTLTQILETLYPIGAKYDSGSSDTLPPIINAIGTWERFLGRVIVGVDESQTEFNTPGKQGGHKLLQSHSHGAGGLGTNSTGSHDHQLRRSIITVGGGGTSVGVLSSGGTWDATFVNPSGNHSHTVSGNTANAGGGDSENLQPYETSYIWKRVA